MDYTYRLIRIRFSSKFIKKHNLFALTLLIVFTSIMSIQFELLKQKLDEFIRKFYLNRLLQGLLLALGGLVGVFMFAAIIEYFGHLGSFARAFLFYGYVCFALFTLGKYVFIPMLKWFHIGKTISYEKASALIGEHFPEIKDKLLNTLQLQQQASTSDNELLLASINQRIKNLSPFTFSAAIDLKSSFKKYSSYAIVPVILLGIILLFQSNVITKSTQRILSYNKQFAREAPFDFVLQNKNLNVLRNTDITIKIITVGKNLPAEVFINLDNHLIKMESTGKHEFSYQMQNLTVSHQFYFTDGDFTSNSFDLNVLPNPVLMNFKVNLTYPAYTDRLAETLNNTGDLTLPKGTTVEWIFNTKDAEKLDFILNQTKVSATKSNNVFTIKQTIKGSTNYYLQLSNQFIASKDTIKYSIQSIDDRYPGIIAEQKQDSINPFVYYFYGKADDDYGISKLQFIYKNTSSNNVNKVLPVSIGKTTDEIFYYMVDLSKLIDTDGDILEYYFEVWDNDGVNGKKSSKSAVFKTVSPSKEQLKADAESSSSSIKQKMMEAMQESISLQKRTQDLNKDLMENNTLDWRQQEKIKDFIKDQKKLENKIDQLKNENKNKNEKENQLNPKDEELLKKQKELDKLFNELLTPEMKEMLKKLEDLLKQQNKEGIQQQMEKMKLNNEDMQKQLDRTLEQYKALELEQKMDEQIKALNDLAEKQADLAEKTKNKSESQEALKKQQEEIDKKFEEVKKELDNIEKKNDELESPMTLEDTKSEESEIDKSLEKGKQNLDKKQNKKASENQKKAADKMKEMASKIEKNKQQQEEEKEAEDYYTLRQILENLIELSYQQENLMGQMKETRSYNPKFVELSAKQRKLKGDAKMVEDSLFALSKRQIQIKSFVNKEISNINNNMDKSITSFSKIEINSGLVQQQYVMTGLNNLSVMLTESLKKMQEQMNENKDKTQGEGQCKNPGGKKPKPGSGKPSNGKPKMGGDGLKKMQEGIAKQLQDMKNGKEQGKNPTSEQYAKIAAQQEALRREIDRLQKMLKEEGKEGGLGDLDKTKELMEKQERDLVNKQITPETMKRSQEIETRMLEHEKSEREQDQDNQREAEQAQNTTPSIPPTIKLYLEKKAKEMELLRSLPAELSPYYKDRVRAYFKKVGNL